MTRQYDILVAGEINPDLVLSDPDLSVGFGQQETLVEGMALTIGASSSIFACGAARLGLRVAIIGVVGDDLFGHFMLDALRGRGVDVTPALIDPHEKTGVSVILSRGADRAILTYTGSIASLRAAQLSDDLLRRSRHLHVASYFLQTALQPGLPDLFWRARELGLTTSLDTNWDPSGAWRGVGALLPLVDVFLPNENEALALSGLPDLEGAVAHLSRQCGLLAVKLGAHGGLAPQGDRIVRAPALPVPVADTVGAGDSFDAGFLYGYLNDWPLERSLRLACACGSLSARLPGGTRAQPTLDEALGALGEPLNR
jgi:sugar/nucleoside kinase (ribokinase family)